MVYCHICGKEYDARDPSVRWLAFDRAWSCEDEPQCFARLDIRRAIDRVNAELEAQGWHWPGHIGDSA